MRRLFVTLILGAAALSLVACGKTAGTSESNVSENNVSENNVEKTIEITSLNGNKEEVQIEVPYNPQRIAILDFASLDIIDNLGVGDRVVGSATTTIDYLNAYMDNDNIANLGTIKEADMEAVMMCEPDVIFIGGRLASSYDALSEIAPVVYLSTDIELGLVKSVEQNTATIAKMFGLEDMVAEKINAFDERIATLQSFGNDKTALVGMVTSGSFNLMGNNGRCSLIGNEAGFLNLTGDTSEFGQGEGRPSQGSTSGEAGSPHGNESSFEVVVAQNPEYIFVLDRDSAIGTQGAQLAKDVMENELIQSTDAYANNRIVYLEHPEIWYTVEGGIKALDIMLQDLEKGIFK